jgi:hypothetical protein
VLREAGNEEMVAAVIAAFHREEIVEMSVARASGRTAFVRSIPSRKSGMDSSYVSSKYQHRT